MKTILVLCLFPSILLADGYHRSNEPGDTFITEVTIVEDQGTAAALAVGGLHFDWATDNWQAGASTGVFGSESAFAFGGAKRLGGALFSGSISRTGSETAGVAAINWRFK